MVLTSRSHPLTPAPNPSQPATPPAASRPSAPAPESPADPLTGALLHFGLGVREAQLYRTLLKYGPMSARQAIGLASLDRATGYRVLSKLRARGLISSTPTRPQRFVPLEVGRLFERTVNVLRDDLELLRILREHFLTEGTRASAAAPRPIPVSSTTTSAGPTKGRWPTVHVYPRADDIGHALAAHADSAKEEFDALMMPQIVPEPLRAEVSRAIAKAVDRGVRVRIILDYHPADLEFLAQVLRAWGSVPSGLEFRFFAPQLARLVLVDHRVALRCIRSVGSPSMGPELGLSSDDAEFVRYQSTRFQAIWREALPMQRAEAEWAPQRTGQVLDNPRDLRRWVERGAIVTGRVAASDLAALFGLGPSAQRRI